MRKFILITFILVSVAIPEKILVDAATKFPELPCAYDDAIQRISERNPIYRNAVDITFQEALRFAKMSSTR